MVDLKRTAFPPDSTANRTDRPRSPTGAGRVSSSDRLRKGPLRGRAPHLASRFSEVLLREKGAHPGRRLPESGGHPTARPPTLEADPPEGRTVLPTPAEPVAEGIGGLLPATLAQLLPPLGSAPGPAPTGSGVHHAEVAALAERVLTSMRVGTTAGQREVRLRLGRGYEGVEVHLSMEGGRVRTSLVDDHGDTAGLEGLADALRREMSNRQIPADVFVE